MQDARSERGKTRGIAAWFEALPAHCDEKRLCRAPAALRRRHDSLRTSAIRHRGAMPSKPAEWRTYGLHSGGSAAAGIDPRHRLAATARRTGMAGVGFDRLSPGSRSL